MRRRRPPRPYIAAEVLESRILLSAVNDAYATTEDTAISPSGPAAETITVGGIEFATNAFADTVLATVPRLGLTFPTSQPLVTAIADSDPGDGVDLAGGYVLMGFVDNVAFNGDGNDLALFQAGGAEGFRVALDFDGLTDPDARVLVPTTPTGFVDQYGENINVGYVDLSDLGVADGQSITSIAIASNLDDVIVSGADLTAVGALHVTAEPPPPPGVLANDAGDPTLMAFWSFDDDTADDQSNHGNDGTLHGSVGLPSFQTDTPSALSGGKSLDFDDSGDARTNGQYVSLDMSFSGAGSLPTFSVSAWFKSSAVDTGPDDNWAILDFDRSEFFNLFVRPTDGRIGFSTRAASIHDMLSDTTGLNDGEWHHVAVTFDASVGKSIYIDGALDHSANPHGGAALGTSATRFGFIGDGSEASSENGPRNDLFYDGSVDDIAMWSRALGSTEIAALHGGDNIVPVVTQLNGSPTLSGSSTEGAGVTMNPDGSFTYDPTTSAALQALSAGVTQNDTFAYTVDLGVGGGSPDTATVTVTVTGVNDPPVITSIGTDSPEDAPKTEGQTVSLTATFTDDVSDTHTATIDWGDSTEEPGSVNESTDTVSGTHSYSTGGIYTVTVTVDDGLGGTDAESTNVFITGVGVHGNELVVIGTNGDDQITIAQQSGNQLVVYGDYLPDSGHHRTVDATSVDLIRVQLLDGDDNLSIANNVTIPTFIDAGSGDDNVWGGGGSNLVLGGAGNDSIFGSLGRDILIGGVGSDILNGGGGEDLLIAGTTAFDSNASALLLIRDEWTSTRDLDDRISNIQAGSGPILGGTGVKLDSTTVFDDGDADTLIGASGIDWLFLNLDDDDAVGALSDILDSI